MSVRLDKTKRGAVFLILGEAFTVGMAAIFKKIDHDLPFVTTLFFRNFFGFLAILVFLVSTKNFSVKTKFVHWHFFRAFVGIMGMYGLFYLVQNIKLAEASMVKLTVPLFLPIIAYYWLNEKIKINHFLALILGFVGVGVLLQPGTENFQPIMIIGLLAALFQALAKVTIRKMSLSEPFGRVIFYFGLFGSIFTLIPALFDWKTPSLDVLSDLILLGIFGTAGQIFITKAYLVASPGKIGAFTFTSIILSSFLGWFVWDEKLFWYFFVGTSLIVVAGFINLYNKK